MNGLTKWILGALFAVLMAAAGLIINNLILGAIEENKSAISAHKHPEMDNMRRNISEIRRRQLIVIEQLILIHGRPAEGPVPPDVMRELLGTTDHNHNGQ